MFKAYKYRIYPTKKQELLLARHFGACRFIYNLSLETRLMTYSGTRELVSRFDLHKQMTDLKKEHQWLFDINSQSLRKAIDAMDEAFDHFFKSKNAFPKFKNKKTAKHSFSVPQKVYIRNGKLSIPKFREGITLALHRCINGEIRQATISKTSTGKYFASILCETVENNNDKTQIDSSATIGVDLGIKSFAVLSNGEEIPNPRFLKKSLDKLKYVQRKYCKHKGRRTKKKLALIHEKVANQRNDFLHKLSTRLIRENQSIALEDLNVKGMLSNHKLAQAISDVSWSSFVTMLEYKAEWHGKNILRIGRFEPSSKTCSCCGWKNTELTLKDREFSCQECGMVMDRDINAAINIKQFALNNLSVGRRLKNQNELPSIEGVLTSEAVILQ